MNNNFVFLGDSLTFGYGVPYNEGWVCRLSKETNLNIINKGINGDTTPSMLDRFYEDVALNNPSKIFFMGGTNDLLLGHSIESIVNNIEEIIKESLKITDEVFIGIPPYIIKEMANKLFIPSPFYSYCEESLPILRIQLINLCNSYNIKYLDLYMLTKENINKKIYIDGIHLNFLGNTLILNKALNTFNFR